jgi:hypothetical protein
MAQGGTSGHRLNPTALIEKVLRRVKARSDAANCRPTRHTSGWKEGAPSCMVQGLLVGFTVQHNPVRLLHPRGGPVRRKHERCQMHRCLPCQ